MTQHQLGGQIGTDPNFSHATHTGHSRAHVEPTDPQRELELTPKGQEIYDGKKGDVLQKAIKTVVDYGRLFPMQGQSEVYRRSRTSRRMRGFWF